MNDDIDTIINKTSYLNINDQCYIYNRVSSKHQEEGMSLESQSKFNHNYCIINNLNINDEIFEVASAWDTFNGYKQIKLTSLINNTNNCNIICIEPTRWSRSVKFTAEMLEILEKNNIILIFTNPELYSNNNRDKGIILLEVLKGENESKLKSNRISRNIKNRKRIGNYYPSIPKFGYSYFKISKNNIKLINNKNESLIQTLVHKLFYGGKVKDINQLLFNITGDNKHFIYDEKFPDEKMKEIQHGNMRIIDVVNFLNCSEIKRRNKYWNSKSVSELL
jgi:DNA invertase Pin-like site-specific DNA recombinase